MAQRRSHNQWKRIGSGTKGARKPRATAKLEKPPIDRAKMLEALVEFDEAFAAKEAARRLDRPLGAPGMVDGHCHDCDRKVSGERLYCGPCLTKRS
jgi:hypothetical protein